MLIPPEKLSEIENYRFLTNQSMIRFLLIALFVMPGLVMPARDKPAVIVLTDIGGDTDDEQRSRGMPFVARYRSMLSAIRINTAKES